MYASQLAVGDPARRRVGTAIRAALILSALFAIWTVAAKETPDLYLHEPWRDDPYDVLVSFDFAALPLLIVVASLRIPLCRRFEPLPARRLVDILNVCAIAVGLSVATQLAEWFAVAHGTHRAQWTTVTFSQLVVLAAMTGATVLCGGLLLRARSSLIHSVRPAAQPDWLADAVDLGRREADRLGPLRPPAHALLRWVDRQVFARVRVHPIRAAAVAAVLLAMPGVAAKIFLERYPAPLVVVVLCIEVASMFTFVVVAGRLMRVIAPRGDRVPAWLSATVVACVAGIAAVAFRNPLLSAVGASPARATTATLAVLLAGVGIPAGALTLLGQTTLRHMRRLRHQ